MTRLAAQRVTHAPAIFGSVDIIGLTELSPVWRPLLEALSAELPTTGSLGSWQPVTEDRNSLFERKISSHRLLASSK